MAAKRRKRKATKKKTGVTISGWIKAKAVKVIRNKSGRPIKLRIKT